jgi:hypothetical protein
MRRCGAALGLDPALVNRVIHRPGDESTDVAVGERFDTSAFRGAAAVLPDRDEVGAQGLTTRRAYCAISSSCVMSTIVRPASLSRTSISAISRLALVSRFPVGSSARIIAGLVTSARAMATRCCCPPESWLGRCPARSARPTSRSAANAGARRSRCGAYISGISTLATAVDLGSRL